MAGLNMKVLLSLQNKAFNKGIKDAQRQIKSLQGSFTKFASAMGAGFGFASFISSVKKITTELDEAKDTLKSVSTNTYAYGESLEFAKKMAIDYRKDIASTITEFSRFSDVANTAGISLDNQKSIYQALTNAIAAYNIPSAKASQIMDTLFDVMAKGYITEKKLQTLQKTMPALYTAIANAAGKSGNALNKMAKDGQLLASSILPSMATELNKVAGAATFDKVSDKLQEMKNAWTVFVDKLEVSGTLNNLYETVTKIINWVTQNLTRVTSGLKYLAETVIAVKLVNGLKNVISAAKAAGGAIKLIGKGSWIGILLGALASIATYFIDANRRAKELKATLIDVASTAYKSNDLYGQLAEAKEKQAKAKAIMDENEGEYKTYLNEGRGARYNKYKKSPYGTHTIQQTVGNSYGAPQTVTLPDNTKDFTSKEQETINTYEAAESAFKAQTDEIVKIEAEIKKLEESNNNTSITPEIEIENTGSNDKADTLEDKITKIFNKFSEDQKSNDNLRKSNLISEKEYNDANSKNTVDFANAVGELIKLPEELEGFNIQDDIKQQILEAYTYALEKIKSDNIAMLNEKYSIDNGSLMPSKGKRDTTFDYKITGADKLYEEFDITSEYVDKLKEKLEALIEVYNQLADEDQNLASVSELMDSIGKSIDKYSKALGKAVAEQKDLKSAGDFAQMKVDIEGLNKQMKNLTMEGFSGVVTGLHGIVDNMKSLQDTLADDNTDGFEKLFSILEYGIQTFQTINGIIETFNALKAVTTMLTEAETIATKKNIAVTVADAVASETSAAAKTQEGLAAGLSAAGKAGDSVASIPYVGPILAIAAIASVIGAMIAAKSKFADGGIVGGHSYTGDKILARVNSGELILNKRQQGRLAEYFNTMDSTGGGYRAGGARAKFRIRGADLVGAIENYNNIKRG